MLNLSQHQQIMNNSLQYFPQNEQTYRCKLLKVICSCEESNRALFKKELVGLIENRNNNDPYNILTIFEKEPKDYNFLNGVSKSKNIGKFIKNYTIGFMLNGHILYFDTIGFTAINTLGHNRTKITLYIKVDGVTDKLPSTLSNSFDLYIKFKSICKR